MLQNENNTPNGKERIEKSGIQLLSFLFILQYVPMSRPEAVTFVQITSPQFSDNSGCCLQTKFN